MVSTDKDARRGAGYAMVFLAACGWGTWPLILRRAVMPSTLQAALVMSIVTLTSLPVMLGDRVTRRAPLGAWLLVGVLGLTDALNVLLLFQAYRTTSVAIAVLTHYLTPLFVALAAPVVLGEPSGPRTRGAVVVSLSGLVLLLEPWARAGGSAGIGGALAGAGSAVFYACNVLLTKRLARWFSGSELMFFHGLVAAPLLLVIVPTEAFGAVSAGSYLVVLAGALTAGTCCNLLFVWGLRRVPAAHASVLTLMEPLVAVVLGAALLAEHLGVLALVGGALVLLGAVLVMSGERPPPSDEGMPGRLRIG